MIHRFVPAEDPFGRPLYLVYGSGAEIKRHLRRFKAAHYWETDCRGMSFSIKQPFVTGTVDAYFICVERGGGRLQTMATLTHELIHFVLAALPNIGIRAPTGGKATKAAEEAVAYYFSWQFLRCMKVLEEEGL